MALALTTYADFAAYMGGLDVADEARNTAILEGVEAGVLRYLRPGIAQETKVEFYDGLGFSELVLHRRPVTAVASVRVDPAGGYGQASDSFGDELEWEAGVDYAVNSLEASESNPGMLVRLMNQYQVACGIVGWTRGQGNIRVEYTAGYAVIPPEIVLAVHQLAGVALGSAGKIGPVARESIGKYSYSMLSGSDAASSGADVVSARGLLAPYSRASDPW